MKAPIVSASLFLFIILCAFPAQAQVKRVVIVKCDGLPYDVVDRFVRKQDPRTGKSQLPWFDYVFYQRGSRVANFYVRGMSLSAPSWSLLETGQHLQIKGNVEFDRYTLHTYDYLNFVPFVVAATVGNRVDMSAVEVLDSVRTPLLPDAFPHDQRYITFSLFQRGPRFITFQKSLENKFKRAPREIFDEWTMGFGLRDAIPEELVRELIRKLNNPQIRYLDLVLTDFDHIAHHNNDRASHLFVLKRMDDVLGRIWTGIQQSPLADETALIVVSDHGFNSSENVYSQGFNLVKLLGSKEGGGHHVVTKRRLMLDYAIKGINPFVPLITTTTRDSFYLNGESTDYPTALLDFDGNERASVHLRNSDLNLLHLLLQQLQRKDISPALRQAATDEFFQTIEQRRAEWQLTLSGLDEELGALRRSIEKQRALWAVTPKKFTREQLDKGLDDDAKRVFAQLDRWLNLEREYTEFRRTLANLLALKPESFAPLTIKIPDVIAKRSMGDRNSIHQLQHYIIGLAPGGLVLNHDGSLDRERSFKEVDYFSLLHNVAVKNNVQAGVSSRPVDMLATRIPASLIANQLGERDLNRDAVWVTSAPDKQALILAREDSKGRLSLRYQPVKSLKQNADGTVNLELADWAPDFPLNIFEDPALAIPTTNRAAWLSEWHTDLEWLNALHRTHYSNGLIGFYEELARHPVAQFSAEETARTADERLMRRLVERQRELIETDLLIMANDHWNFDVRGFNPGGNHGSFFRISTHSTLMFAGGEKTRLPRGLVVEEPYDSLSFVPTVLALTGNLRDDSNPVQILWDKGFRHFPGRVIREVLPEFTPDRRIAATGASNAPR